VNGGTDFSGAIPIGFGFDFYCNAFTQAYFSTGGYMTFNNGVTSTAPAAIPGFPIPNNLIAYCWSSLDMLTINYETQGTAPNRRFVADISGIHWFSAGINPPNGDPVIVQIVLFEGGAIEFHITQINASWFSGMVQGIEGPNGTNGVAISGRNNTFGWFTANEGIRFEPQPASITYTWTPNTDINDPTLEDPTVSPTVDTWYYVTYDDGNCILTDSVFVAITPLFIDTGDVWVEIRENILQISPNPNRGVFHISGWEEASENIVLELYSLKGQRVLQKSKALTAGFSIWEINLKGLPNGLYFYRIHTGNNWQEGKMMKQEG
jgi:hypothetical protein